MITNLNAHREAVAKQLELTRRIEEHNQNVMRILIERARDAEKTAALLRHVAARQESNERS